MEIREAAQLGIFFALTLLINFYYFGTNPVAMRVCLRKVRIHNATFGAIAVSGNDRYLLRRKILFEMTINRHC